MRALQVVCALGHFEMGATGFKRGHWFNKDINALPRLEEFTVWYSDILELQYLVYKRVQVEERFASLPYCTCIKLVLQY